MMPLASGSETAQENSSISSGEVVEIRAPGARKYTEASSSEGGVVYLDQFRPCDPVVDIPGLLDIDDIVAGLEEEEGAAEAFHEARAWAADLFGSEGQTLQSLRLRRGLSQAQLAAIMGTKQPNIARLEAGKDNMTLDTCFRLADALAVDLNTLGEVVRGQQRLREGS